MPTTLTLTPEQRDQVSELLAFVYQKAGKHLAKELLSVL
jgi:hypothetical protein